MTIPPEAANLYPEPGTVIDNKYRCERLIGAGGMGAVALATHLIRKAPVALKFMHPGVSIQEGFVERFINEAVAASRIDSEHVVKVFDVGQLQEGTPYLVMEYLEG
ncbi:MAG TPA: protein kinase, partial [Polyangiaceae bacterium]|nr:protein kinase [Polyangiaceae bacterium]